LATLICDSECWRKKLLTYRFFAGSYAGGQGRRLPDRPEEQQIVGIGILRITDFCDQTDL
jgi:hypothetical protein